MKTKTRVESDFLTARELTQRMGYKSNTELWRRVRAGIIPLPHSKRSAQIFVWRRDWYEHFRETGRWPKDLAYQPQN
jgi:hypothetical protein